MNRTREHDGVYQREILPEQEYLLMRALRLTRNREQAMDLVQDTLEKAWRARAEYIPQGKPAAWLNRIMKNAFLTQWRYEKRRPLRNVIDTDINEEHLSTSISDGISRMDSCHRYMLSDAAETAISSLPDHQRTPFILHVLEGYDYESIADILAIPLNTVRTRIHRARRRLQRIITKPSQLEVEA